MNKHSILIQLKICVVAFCLNGALLAGQAALQEPVEPEGDVLFQRGVMMAPVPEVFGSMGGVLGSEAGQGDRVMFVSAEMSFDSRVVKGAPYAAEAVTEHVQTLSDGNRITSRNSSSVYRDAEGRTRRAQTIGAVGSLGTLGELPETFFINDPVAGLNYVLNPRTRTARRLELPKLPELAQGGEGRRIIRLEEGGATFERALPAPRAETLGRQLIEGIAAEGTRTTITIEAGEIGNERPIEIVSERWYSPELQTVVLSRHSDPRTGENVYRLTKIDRREPDPALFRVPQDYKVIEGPGNQFFQKALDGLLR